MVLAVAVCLLLAGISLLGPSEPSYDPWAWLVWGREIAHFGLNTTGGPSWKPLPVIFTTAFAPLSKLNDGIPPALWIVVARAGALLAVALAFKVAARMVGGGAVRRIAAGSVAAVAVVLTPDWIRYAVHGNEIPLAAALGLWAVDRHLSGDRRGALVLGGLVCLARPELFGFVLIYAAYLWWRDRGQRWVAAAVAIVVPLAWVVPSWYGSGDPLFAGNQARSEPSWSLSLMPVPWRAALDVAQAQAWLALELAAVAAIVFALPLAALARRRGGAPGTVSRLASFVPRPARPGAVAIVGAFAAAVVAMFALMTEAGFSGNVRYVQPALLAIALLGGVGAGLVVDLGARVGERIAAHRPAVRPVAAAMCGAAVAAALLVAALPEIRAHVEAVDLQARDAVERSHLHTDLERAVDGLGARYVTLFGPATTNRSYQTHLAWSLSLPLSDVQGARGRGMMFRAPADDVSGVVRVYRRARERTPVTRVGEWTVSVRPPNARHVFSYPWRRFAFHLCTAHGLGATPRASRCSNPRAGSPEVRVRRDDRRRAARVRA